MNIIITLASLAASVTSLAIPQTNSPTTGGPYPPYPSSTNVTYYDGPCSGYQACSPSVSGNILSASKCTPIYHTSLGVTQAPNNDCSLTVYKGNTSCGGGGETVSYQLAKGNATLCVNLDLAAGEKASGVWMCG